MDPATRPHLASTFHGFYSVNPYSAIMAKAEHIIAVSDCIADHIAEEYRPQAPVTTVHRESTQQSTAAASVPKTTGRANGPGSIPHLQGNAS